MRVLYGLLAVPAFAVALFSLLILDAPWAAEGWGAALAWWVIVNCWALPISLLVAAGDVQRWHYALLALLCFLITVVALLIIEAAQLS
jgi:hypothetical protein